MKKLFFILVPISILLSACSGAVKKPAGSGRPGPLSGEDAGRLFEGATKHIGEPYRYGGISSNGWDCSGFVYGMFKKYLNVSLPRDTKGLYSASVMVKPRNTRPGDLVFFRIGTAKPSHVGIYMGRNRFIHASTSAGVIVSNLGEDYYRKRFIGYRRLHYSYLANLR